MCNQISFQRYISFKMISGNTIFIYFCYTYRNTHMYSFCHMAILYVHFLIREKVTNNKNGSMKYSWHTKTYIIDYD